MLKFILTVTAAAAALVAPVASASETRFTYEGVTYTYSTTEKDGVQTIVGNSDDGTRYKLRVRNGWVDGYFDGRRVTFRVPREKASQVALR